MRNQPASLALLTPILLLFIGCTSQALEPPTREQRSSSAPVVVVELFTSEGCSSCPPADRTLAQLLNRAQRDNLPVVGLSFHVDYWDRLGWKDRFADPAYTRRQRDYALAFRLRSVYTPQAVVNGTDQFIGSDVKRLDRAVSAGLKQKPTGALKLTPTKADTFDGWEVGFDTQDVGSDMVLNLALVEDGAVSRVTRGENAGRKLQHVNIVRVFRTVALTKKPSGRVQLQRPQTLQAKNVKLIGYVQHAKTKAIGTAAEIALD